MGAEIGGAGGAGGGGGGGGSSVLGGLRVSGAAEMGCPVMEGCSGMDGSWLSLRLWPSCRVSELFDLVSKVSLLLLWPIWMTSPGLQSPLCNST